MSERRPAGPRITVVGVCGSGKSELTGRLQARGLDAHAVAQEHSHVPYLWRHEEEPDVLVYLSARLDSIRRRGKAMTAAELREQRRRLASARRHAQVDLRTDDLTPAEVETAVLALIERYNALTAHGSERHNASNRTDTPRRTGSASGPRAERTVDRRAQSHRPPPPARHRRDDDTRRLRTSVELDVGH